MNLQAIACPLCVVAAIASAASGINRYSIGSDPRPRAEDGRIVVDAFNDDTLQFDSDVRHFGWQLGEIADVPFFTGDPGFSAVSGSGLPAGQQMSFDVVHRLAMWDGAPGAVAFVPPMHGESLQIKLGSAVSTVNNAFDAVAGFAFTNIGSGGAFHRHLNSTLQPGDSPTPSPGLYFTAIRLATSGVTLAHSDALYLAYNNGLLLADFQRGMAYLANSTPGDADFDHDVDFADLLVLAKHFKGSGDANWFDADFDRSRTVDFDDLLILAQQFNTPATFAADWTAAQSVLPEPVIASLLIGGVFTRRRRVG